MVIRNVTFLYSLISIGTLKLCLNEADKQLQQKLFFLKDNDSLRFGCFFFSTLNIKSLRNDYFDLVGARVPGLSSAVKVKLIHRVTNVSLL